MSNINEIKSKVYLLYRQATKLNLRVSFMLDCDMQQITSEIDSLRSILDEIEECFKAKK